MPTSTYNPGDIEPKWQAVWTEQQVFRTPAGDELKDRPKFYVLDMFPYPSGDGLHVGHPEGYTATDVIARMRRMQGYNVLHPMGWDAFGLPAERAAERQGVHPAVVTARNVAAFRRQLQRMGFSYDWEREINTSIPDYYRWTQWIFLKLFDRGLAYMADVPVNWCPALGTVLSNEEVHDGKYVETGDPVERRLMRQWMLKITAYAERLLADLDMLDWPESLKEMQRNWIGKSEGARIVFQVQNGEHAFEVFTTRPDTLFGATYCVLAPEHPLIEQIVTEEERDRVTQYAAAARNKPERERLITGTAKTGVFTGAYAINPANGLAIPIWVADYVLISYGTGASMAVPGHDERDHEFARQFGLPIVYVVGGGATPIHEAAYPGEGISVNSGFLNGLPTVEAKRRMIDWLEETGNGRGEIQYRLRDWLFSRQRYWGEPFPIVHLDDGAIVKVPENQLPVELPSLDENKAIEPGQPPLARAVDDWLMVTLPDGRTGVRETNTMPQWAGSCWYYLRFIDPHNDQEPWSAAAERYWMPVDLYIGGVEHAVLHLLYARFWHKVLYDCGLVSTQEPFQKLFNQGLIQAYSYQDARGKYYYPRQVEERDGSWFVAKTGAPVQTQLEKMSKSRLNVYGLDEVVDAHGADALRLYELFIGPLSASTPWNMAGIDGTRRFLYKVWRLVVDERTGDIDSRVTDASPESEPDLQRLLHKTIQGVSESIESIDKMNTAVSRMMTFANSAAQARTLPRPILMDFLRLLSPFAPHIAEELWARLGISTLLVHDPWPEYDADLVADEEIEIPVQINGRLRTVMLVEADSDETRLRQLALSNDKISRYIHSKTIDRVIVVPNRLVNIIVSS
jgi:leucyl-tRNA synthetase